MKSRVVMLLSIVLALSLAGCACMEKQPEPVKPAPKPAPAPVVEKPKPAPAACDGCCRVYPCECCPVLRLQKVMPDQVALNAPFDYEINVTNMTDKPLHAVVVKDNLADHFQFKSSNPAAAVEGKTLVWKMDTLEPKASKKLVVSGAATKAEDIWQCADATYILPACCATKVVQPSLALSKSAPERVTICDEIPIKLVVENKGTGPANNVKISDPLPDGLVTKDGKTTIDINAGNLPAGQSKQFSVVTVAKKTGTFENKAMAVADGGLKAESGVTKTVVTKPVLAITKTGTENQYLGRKMTYTITVTNKGDSPAVDTIVEDTIPAGVKEVALSAGGSVVGAKAVWKLGTLDVNASKQMTISYSSAQAGEFANTATAQAVCADAVSASAKTMVKGIAAILLEVVDVDDPIELGQNETYEITVTNQGSSPDTNITIKCVLENEFVQYVSSSGVTTGTLEGNTITFSPLPTLAPKAKATWKVIVKGIKAGDVRTTVIMNSDQLGRDVQETEATNFYE